MTHIKVNTKSNYRNLNGQWLQLSEIVGSRMSCKVFIPEFQSVQTVDFNISEVVDTMEAKTDLS